MTGHLGSLHWDKSLCSYVYYYTKIWQYIFTCCFNEHHSLIIVISCTVYATFMSWRLEPLTHDAWDILQNFTLDVYYVCILACYLTMVTWYLWLIMQVLLLFVFFTSTYYLFKKSYCPSQFHRFSCTFVIVSYFVFIFCLPVNLHSVIGNRPPELHYHVITWCDRAALLVWLIL